MLRFSLFETALVRQSVLMNGSDKALEVTKLMSACADLHGRFTVSTFDGGWIRETHRHTVPAAQARVVPLLPGEVPVRRFKQRGGAFQKPCVHDHSPNMPVER